MSIDTAVSADTSCAIDEWTEPAVIPTGKEAELMLKIAQVESDYANLVERLEKLQQTHMRFEAVVPAELRTGDEILIPVKVTLPTPAPIDEFFVRINPEITVAIRSEDLVNAVKVVEVSNDNPR